VAIGLCREERLEHVLVDQNQLENALLNLAINWPRRHARRRHADDRRIERRARASKRPRDARRRAGRISGVLSVSDTGIGMPPKVLEHVFEAVLHEQRPMATGTGLGLSMVFGFVKQSGGTHRESRAEVGRGTTVRPTSRVAMSRMCRCCRGEAAGRSAPRNDTRGLRRPPTFGLTAIENADATRLQVLKASNGDQRTRGDRKATPRFDLLFTDRRDARPDPQRRTGAPRVALHAAGSRAVHVRLYARRESSTRASSIRA